MANRNYTPIMFALEKNVVFLAAQATFDGSGNPTLITNNSKGICNLAVQAVMLNGNTTASSTSVSSVTNFTDIFVGQTVSGTGIQASTTISSFNVGAGTITLSKVASSTNPADLLAVTGGQYTFQFGFKAVTNLDTYPKLLMASHNWDESTGSASGTVSLIQSAPAAPAMFIVGNNTQIKTIPATSTSGSTDATLTVQFGTGAGTSFIASNPGNGDLLRMFFMFGNSTAP